MAPAHADIEREPGLCVPVILHINTGLPETEVLALLIDLPGNLVRLALNHIFQIQEWGLCEPEVAQAVGILIIVKLSTDQTGAEFDIVRASGPGQRTLFLK